MDEGGDAVTTHRFPLTAAEAYAALDRAIEDRQDLRAQLENHYSLLTDAQRQNFRLATELQHACSELQDVRDHRDELLVRVDELRQELADLKGEK